MQDLQREERPRGRNRFRLQEVRRRAPRVRAVPVSSTVPRPGSAGRRFPRRSRRSRRRIPARSTGPRCRSISPARKPPTRRTAPARRSTSSSESAEGVPAAPPGPASARGDAIIGLGAAAYLGLHALAAGRVPPGAAADPVIEALRGLRLVLLRRFEVLTVAIGPSAETLWLYVTGASVAVLGPTRTAFLVPSILAATATLVLVAALVRRVRPPLPIGLALLVPASSLWLFHSGEVGLRASAAPLVLLGACFLLDDRAEKDVADRPFAAGVLLGLGVYAYSACRLLPIAWVLHFALRWHRTPSARPALGREARRLLLAFALVSIPNLLFLFRAPGLLLDRGYYVSRGTPLDKLGNVLATFLLPFVYPDRYRVWIGSGHVFDATGVALTASGVDPFDLVAGPLAVLGLLAWRRGRESAALSYLLVTWAAGSVLLGLYGPSLTRLLILLPAWLVFAALGCDALLSRAPRLKLPLAALLVLSMCLQARAWISTFGRSESAALYFHEAATAMAERARDLHERRQARDRRVARWPRRLQVLLLATHRAGLPRRGPGGDAARRRRSARRIRGRRRPRGAQARARFVGRRARGSRRARHGRRSSRNMSSAAYPASRPRPSGATSGASGPRCRSSIPP